MLGPAHRLLYQIAYEVICIVIEAGGHTSRRLEPAARLQTPESLGCDPPRRDVTLGITEFVLQVSRFLSSTYRVELNFNDDWIDRVDGLGFDWTTTWFGFTVALPGLAKRIFARPPSDSDWLPNGLPRYGRESAGV